MSSSFASDRMQKFDAQTGMLVISPANVESKAVWRTKRENISIALHPESLIDLAASEVDRGCVDLRPIPFETVDQSALYLARMLKAELSERESANELYVDSLITLLGIHLLRNYTEPLRPLAPSKGSLPKYKAKKIRDYLHANFRGKLSIAELSAMAGISPGHFIKAFTRTFGATPHQYLINLRIAAAERLLSESDLSISEIAYASGFSSQSHLTTAMRKHKGTTPARIREDR